MNKQRPRICINIRDGWADIYSFATLYEFLIKNNFEANFKISPSVQSSEDFKNLVEQNIGKNTRLGIISSGEYRYSPRDFDIVLNSYCDLPIHLTPNELAIDLSILKNCVEPTTREKKIELRKKYDVPLEEKVIVLGFPSPSSCEEYSLSKVISELFSKANLYLVGTTRIPSDLPKEARDLVTDVYSRDGILKDYYALADVAMINWNIEKNNRTLHNFIEATAGGPLFLVPPDEGFTKQYGYKQIVKRRVIREAENTDHLIKKVKQYLQNPEEEYVREQRTLHLAQSRELYLTDLMRLLNKLLRISDEPFESDLQFISDIYSKSRKEIFLNKLKIIHPQTVWSMNDYESERHAFKSLNSKILDDKCFRRGVK